MTIELPFEMEFILSLTYKCNLKCKMCTQYGEGFKEQALLEMSLNEWANFFETISDVTPKPKMLLMGGEPLLYKDFDKLFELTQKHGFNVQIVTNGVLLDKYLPLLSKSDARITISLDGLEKTHDEIRNKSGTFKKVIENIKKIQELQKQGSKMQLSINCVMLPDNVDELVDFLIFIQDFNIEILTFQHLQFSSSELNNLSANEWRERLNQEYAGGLLTHNKYILNDTYIEKLKTAIGNLKKTCTINGFLFPALEDDELENYYLDKNLQELRVGRICTTPWLNPTIHSDGNVSNCIGNMLGNINKENFWDLWNNEKANNLRTSLLCHGKFTICSKCCNFYKGNFIFAPNSQLKIKEKRVLLPDAINFIKSSKEGVFIQDKSRQIQENQIPVIPVELFSNRSLEKIKETEKIIGYFSDIKGA